MLVKKQYNNDPSVISNLGPKSEGHKCANCYVRGSEKTLKICAQCKSAKYCSRECQAAHWKQHKDTCKRNAEHAEEVTKVDASGARSFLLPPGVSFSELDQRLEKWIKFHNSTLMAATIHALALPRDITRSQTHVLSMTVRHRMDGTDVPATRFRFINARVIEIAEAQKLPAPWPESLEQLATLREESESKQRGTVAAVGIECPPLGVQFVPFGSLRGLSPLKILPNWKDILKGDIETGKKFTRFGS